MMVLLYALSPGTVYRLCEEDVFVIAKQKGLGEKEVTEKMRDIRRGIEYTLHNWVEVVEAAIEIAMER